MFEVYFFSMRFLVLYISFLVIFMPTLAYFSFAIEITACVYLCVHCSYFYLFKASVEINITN